MTLIPDPTLVFDGLLISPSTLSLLIAGSAMVILGISLSAASIARHAKGEVREQRILLDCALENMSQVLSMFDAEGRILLFNERYMAMTGRTDPELRGRLLLDVLREQKAAGRWQGEPEEFFAKLVADAQAGRSAIRVIEQRERSMRVVTQPMKSGGWVATFEDITEWEQAQAQAQAQISHMARHDALTNLPNRTLFREELERAHRAMLHQFRELGVMISLDDFGTGYSSLSYLRSFPFDKIKIDRSFINELANGEDSLAIVRAVTGLGKSLGIVTTAEGVETNAQLDLLAHEGCTQAQGYLISKPRPIAEVEGMLIQPRASAVA